MPTILGDFSTGAVRIETFDTSTVALIFQSENRREQRDENSFVPLDIIERRVFG